MATTKDTPTPAEESQYATGPNQTGKPVGPEHDGSFSAPDFYDPKTGKRIETAWDTEAQKNDPGFDPKVMAGTTETPAGEDAADQGKRLAGKGGGSESSGQGEGGASGGEAGEHSTKRGGS